VAHSLPLEVFIIANQFPHPQFNLTELILLALAVADFAA